ncbi:hypothetical protein [Pseudoxanthomonas suwonensis]|uniref:Uncharacterized protein n=1 Tax=Pseudoxanthomonas suwonensis TaxID=314722 RepID=A0A0E3UMU4_9GAMM|nr:hypothetical protein [Pseudoxanthomonas suwonensis]AKC86606.1 hypothetical protein WQ53_07330 [Pseudoxanthomonas suwonensis]
MNAKTLSAAMSLILSLAALSATAADNARVDHIVDLPTVTVQPDAGLRAELASAAMVGHVVDLPTVTVRPDAALRTELMARTAVARIVDLPAVHVRPTAEQLADRAAVVAAEQAQALTAQLGTTLLAETLAVALP